MQIQFRFTFLEFSAAPSPEVSPLRRSASEPHSFQPSYVDRAPHGRDAVQQIPLQESDPEELLGCCLWELKLSYHNGYI